MHPFKSSVLTPVTIWVAGLEKGNAGQQRQIEQLERTQEMYRSRLGLTFEQREGQTPAGLSVSALSPDRIAGELF